MARIVIADDHEIVRNGLKAMLEDAGWQVCAEAENGEEAVRKVSELLPDLVILDITMPVMNGIQAAHAIRELAPDIKIALFSIHDLTLFKNPSVAAPADAYLMKTARSQRIVHTISQLLAAGAVQSGFNSDAIDYTKPQTPRLGVMRNPTKV